jgi:pyridoxal phosphate enzyme (YggS family)
MNDPESAESLRLAEIAARIAAARRRFGPPPERVALIAVSKTFPAPAVLPFLEAGQRRFGENRVQEAKAKWPALQARYPDVELHLIGPLQTNKVRDAVALFDVIETLDRERLAVALRAEFDRVGKNLPCFIEVNVGGEAQKSGVGPADTPRFVDLCRRTYGLNIVGLMCVPPAGLPPGPYFAQLAQLGRDAGLPFLSMGMSGDFETAIAMGATHVRVGSALFGARPVSEPGGAAGR